MSTRIACPCCTASIGEHCVTTAGRAARFMHAGRYYRFRDRMRSEEFFVRLVEDDERFGLRGGDILRCINYPLDAKATVLRRESDGYDPQCNQYWHDIEFVDFVADRAVK